MTKEIHHQSQIVQKPPLNKSRLGGVSEKENKVQKRKKRMNTSQCQPPSPTAFLTTPCRPTNTDFVLLFPVTMTLVCLGRTESSSSPLSSWEGDSTLEAHSSGSSIFPNLNQNCTKPSSANKDNHRTQVFFSSTTQYPTLKDSFFFFQSKGPLSQMGLA